MFLRRGREGMDAKLIGERIRQMRKDRHLRQSDLAKELGVRKTTISNYETGYSIPKREVLGKISKFFGVSMDYLCASTDETKKYLQTMETYHQMEEIPQYEYYPFSSSDGTYPRPRTIRATRVSRHHAQDTTFSTVVPDNAMNRLRLCEGDEVLVKEQNYANVGQIVLAYLCRTGEVVIRRFYQNGQMITLMPDSTDRYYEPIMINVAEEPMEILGVISSAVIQID